MAEVWLALAGRVTAPAEVEVDVRALAAGGDGIAELPDGRVVFIPRTAPGDHARIRVTRSKKRWARGELSRLDTEAPIRVEPPCPLYSQCGGCSLQHIEYDAQLQWKAQFVADAFQRIGGVEMETPEVVASPRQLRYRNRITYTLRRLRGGKVVAGFHALDRPTHVLDVEGTCLLPEEPLTEAWMALRAGWGTGARRLPQGGRLTLTLRNADEGVVLVVGGGEPGWDPRALAEAVPQLRALWHQPERSRPAMRVLGDAVADAWGPDRFPVSGQSFLQVNREAAAPLLEHVLELARPAHRTVDAYCGVGLYGRALARAGQEVVGIELDPDACAAAAADPPPGFEVRQGAVEELLPGLLPADVVILNPPRTGLHEDVPAALSQAAPARVVYVSCDPATLARDAARLGSTHRVTSLRSFDLFPQTAHVETVACFELREGV